MKKKLAESADTASEPQPENQCGDGMKLDPDTGECVPIADAEVVGAAGAAQAEKGLVGMVRAVVKELVPVLRQEFRTEAREMIDQELGSLRDQFGVSLRKELGLTTDPTVTKSELDAAIRKSVLDLKTGGKRTPATTLEKSSDEATKRPGEIFKTWGNS